jgi:hypothetical protein
MQYVEFIVTRPTTGAALPSAKVTVYLAGTTTLATLYNAAGGGISNPATADASGLIGFAAANGSYDFSAASADGSYVVPTIHRQQFYDLSGLDAQVTLAQSAAATATAAIATTSGSAAAAAASAATAGSAATTAANTAVATLLPYNDTNLAAPAYSQFPASATISTDGKTMLCAAGVGQGIDAYFTPAQIASGLTATAFLQAVGASVTFSQRIGRWYTAGGAQVGGDITIPQVADGLRFVGSIPATATFLRFAVAATADTQVLRPATSVGSMANPVVDPLYLTLTGEAQTQADTTEPLYTFSPPAAYVNGVLPIASGVILSYFVPLPVSDPAKKPNDGDRLWVIYELNTEPSIIQATATAAHGVSGGGSGASINGQPYRIGPNVWLTQIDVASTGGINDFYGVRLFTNTATAGLQFKNVSIWRGLNPPLLRDVSKLTRAYIDKANAQARRDLSCKVAIAVHTDSIETNQAYPYPAPMLQDLAGPGYIIRSLSIPGASLTQVMTMGGLLPVPITVTGGVIPADLTPVSVSWPAGYDPISSNALLNPDWENAFYLRGVLGKLVVSTWSGFVPAANSTTFVRLTSDPRGIATDCPAASPMVPRHFRETKGGKRVILTNSVNGFGTFSGTTQQLIEAVTANLNPADVLLLSGLSPSTGGYALAPAPTWLTGHRLQNCYVDINATDAAGRARAQLAPINWTPAGGDLAAMAAGTTGIPASARFSGDSYHPFTAPSSFLMNINIVRSGQFQSFGA